MEKAFQDPALFAETFFNFKPTQYQADLLQDKSKRIVVRWSRQSGKTTTIALRAIWYALSHSKTLTLIIAPSLRQSMIMSDRITDFLSSLPPKYFNLFVKKLQRTVIQLNNNSRIIALPNNPQLLQVTPQTKLFVTKQHSSKTTNLSSLTYSTQCLQQQTAYLSPQAHHGAKTAYSIKCAKTHNSANIR